MYPDAGKMDRRVTIQQRSSTDQADSSGTPIDVGIWTTLVTVPAQKGTVGGREKFASGQESAPYDTRWTLRYRADMDPELVEVPKTRRIVYQGRIHDIVSAELIGRREGVDLLTLAGGTIA